MEPKIVRCPRCDGDGKVFSGYYGHPETSSGGPIMHRCSVCEGDGFVTERERTKYIASRIPDFC